jgi:hypothetical protein
MVRLLRQAGFKVLDEEPCIARRYRETYSVIFYQTHGLTAAARSGQSLVPTVAGLLKRF